MLPKQYKKQIHKILRIQKYKTIQIQQTIQQKMPDTENTAENKKQQKNRQKTYTTNTNI